MKKHLMVIKEAAVEKYLKDEVKRKKGITFKVKWIGTIGAPDRIVLLPRKFFFLELKRPGKYLSPHQERMFKKLQKFSVPCKFANSFKMIDELL